MKWRRFLFEGEILRLMGLTAMTKPLGLATQMLIAAYFGAGHQLDAYAFAMFPIMFFSQTIQRIFSAVAIPQIIKIRQSMAPDRVDAYQNAIILFFYLPFIGLILTFLFGGNLFVDLVGRQLPPETKVYAYRMLRFLAIPGVFACLVGLNSALLNLNKKFRVPASMPVLNAAVMLVSLLLLHGRLGIWALPAGFAFSYLIQGPIVITRAIRTGSLTFARPALPPGALGTIWSLGWMIVLTQALLMINTFIDKWFATGLEPGSISSITYSLTLMTFGVQLFSTSLVVVMFTKMSEMLARGDVRSCDAYIQTNLIKVTNLVVPVSLGLFVVSPEVVRILFQRGAFDAADALRTSGTLSMYILGLPALVINGIVTRIFHSQQRLKEKIFLALQYVVTNVIGNLLLVKTLATVGLAISTSTAINLHVLLSLLVLHRFGGGLEIGKYMTIIGRAYAMALLVWLVYAAAGIDGALTGLLDGTTLAGAFGLALAKFVSIILLYGVQVGIWFRYFRAKPPTPTN